MIEYSFVGEKDNQRTGLFSQYNESNGATGAQTVAGGTPIVQYDFYMPDNNIQGDLVARKWISGTLHELFFNNVYPFVTAQQSVMPDPGYNDIQITSLVATGTSAVGVNDGSVTINASGGTGPYEYSLDGIDWYSTNVLSGLPAQGYTVFVRGASLLLGTGHFTIDIISPPPPAPIPVVKDVITLAGAEIQIQNAFKRVKVLSKFGKAPSVIANGDFEVYDGQNWEFWVKYGGINVSRIQRSVTNTNGSAVLIQNYALLFNERAQQSRYLQHSDIPIQTGDTVKMSYRVSQTVGTGTTQGSYNAVIGSTTYPVPATYRVFYISKIRIKVGSFYLYNADYGNGYEWVNQVATVSHIIDNPQGDLSNYLVNFNIPEAPITGAIVIQWFGFQKVQTITTEEYKPTAFITIPPLFFTNDLSEYSPIAIDEVTATKTSQSGDNDITGILNISDNLRFFSQIPDTFELLFGDYFYRRLATEQLDNLYAIKYDGQYTTGWYEYLGGSAKTVPFGLGLAKFILTAFQKPFRKWVGGLKLKPTARPFSYLDVFSFDVPNSPSFNRKQFVVLGGDINQKDRQFENLSLVEIFDKEVKSNDVSVPSYDDMPDPVFVQDPNAVTNNGIFTSEFTQEFV
jgi:hypothetical protein